MQVTSMLSAGYLQPSVQSSDLQSRRAQAASEREKEAALSRQERDVLSQEQNLRAKLGAETEVHTVYRYTVGADGQRYISGASVTMKGEEDDLNRVGGVTTRIEAREDAETASERVPEAEEKAGAEGRQSADSSDEELSEEEQSLVRKLEQTQREVVAHEMAHQASAGALGGGASYTYTEGPDGKSYITGGEVPIQLRTGATPEETLRNMQQVQRAATAPADPSGQDRRVAAQAAAMAAKARAEMAAERAENASTGEDDESRTAKVAEGTPVFDRAQAQANPLKTGVTSVLASIREAELQNQLLAA